MTARGTFPSAAAASSGNDAPDVALFQLAADPLGRSRIGNRSGLDAIIDPPLAEIRADRVVLLGGGGPAGEGRAARPARERFGETPEPAGEMAHVDAPNDDDIPF